MPATVVLGAQWGDEGKGKAIDQLAPRFGWTVRFQGGNNAGHTIVIGDTTLKLHQIPSGLPTPHCNLVLGDGMVIDPWVLEKELDSWRELTGERPEESRLFISERASVILPFHRMYDSTDKVVGTTGRGIGPAYRDRIERVGIRFADIEGILGNPGAMLEISKRMTSQLLSVGMREEITVANLEGDLRWILDRFSKSIAPTGPMLDIALRNGENVLLEGAQGAMLDIDQGTYPFVTSSVTSRANASHGAGIHPGHIDACLGVTKAYTTRVGNGPFPTEIPSSDPSGSHMATIGHEFGTTTGRPRRTGWLDIPALMEAQRVNGFTGLVLTKLDVLAGLEEIKICIGYEMDGRPMTMLPARAEDVARCKPVYETHEGFKSISEEEWLDMAQKSNDEKKWIDSLPATAASFVKRIEELSGIPVECIGIGADRRATLSRPGGIFDLEFEMANF
ncbi:MAG: adenylosuccinate synthase [Euryarchaeota archaeon]|nr:adenylosuccinate synthase [Euryarchaeota archaeon]